MDVSECEEVFSSLLPIENAKVKCGINNPCECKEFPDCYFKQLKRAEQKLEIAQQTLKAIEGKENE